MAGRKLDIVIEAVRCDAGGQLTLARAYERRGPTWSDVVLLSRSQLVDRLKLGRRAVVGERIPLLGSTFTTGAELRLQGAAGAEALVCEASAGAGDCLCGAPLI
jgi:hypothetical protein